MIDRNFTRKIIRFSTKTKDFELIIGVLKTEHYFKTKISRKRNLLGYFTLLVH